MTLRRAAFLAQRLAAERRGLVAARGAAGAGGTDAAALEGRIAVVNKQLATTVDVMVTLREAVGDRAAGGAAAAGGKRKSRQGALRKMCKE